MAPKKLRLTDISQSFEADTIISQKTKQPISFKDLMADLKSVRVIYVGENHTDPAHHAVQLKILQALFQQNADISIGMEMFDHSYQHILEKWSAGSLDQKSFLKKTHWYANWKFDFNLYKNILDYAQKNHIRVVGINIPFHIPRKISIGGIENLLEDDKKHLPEKIDTSISAHRAYLEEIFKDHYPHAQDPEAFENFYAAQCVWEDTMAEAIARNLTKGQMLVIAGNGHIRYKYGIPQRAFERTTAAFRTIFPAPAGMEAQLSYADYIWVTAGDKKKAPRAQHP